MNKLQLIDQTGRGGLGIPHKEYRRHPEQNDMLPGKGVAVPGVRGPEDGTVGVDKQNC
jgi:hypothetical protein